MLEVIREEQLCERATLIGEQIKQGLRAIEQRYQLSCFGDIRGPGAMVALELVKDRDANSPDADLAKALVQKSAEHGLLLLSCGTRANVIRFLVPLTAAEAIVAEGLDKLEQALVAVLNLKQPARKSA
jgi:4-aminobutyrate aminotransferase / (S)-3-amino-2-methylpropionate transaminase / 5-aminovalerate transaminase